MHNYTIMMRQRILLPLLIGGLFVGVAARQGLQAASDPEVIAAKAQELSGEHTDHASRIIRMHAFVQDEIRETKTTYG